jgi:putative holliday junction resolvase
MNGRVLAVDPGEKRLGIAVSDPMGMIANPLKVIKHVSRAADAEAIANLAREQAAVCIVVGQALDAEGRETAQARHAASLAEAIRGYTEIPVILWDESGSTKAARAARIAMGVKRSKRRGHLDEIAATVILQSYLNAQSPGGSLDLPLDFEE